jgi:hypothetical protein
VEHFVRTGVDNVAAEYRMLAALKAEILTEAQAREAVLLAQARKEERERCYQAVAAEHLHEPNSESEGDAIYDRAIADALQAIRDLESEEA